MSSAEPQRKRQRYQCRSDSDSDSVGGTSQDDDTSLTPSGSESVVDEDDFDTGNPKIRTGTM